MGIKDMFKKNTGTIRDSCERLESGEIKCKRVQVNPDGTEVDLAGFTMGVDASCNAVAVESHENEPGALNELERKFVPKIIGKCSNRPAEY